jgi:transposase-like protein
MKSKSAFPQTLAAAIRHFADLNNCIDFLANLRWPEGVICPKCGSKEVSYIKTRRIWKCKQVHDHRQFSVKVGTIMEDSPIPLDKWLTAMWLICNCRNGVSSYEVGRDLGVTQKSAWFMMHRIRLAMQNGSFLKLGGPNGEVEVDETFIGGLARNMHKSVWERRIKKAGHTGDKAVVFGILERGKEVRTMVVPDRKGPTVLPIIEKHVHAGTALFTDDMKGYRRMPKEFLHKVVDHTQKYVDGRVHTNGLENFWSLLKRGLGGTYVAVEPFHLFRYLDEQAFRYNNRKDNMGEKLNDAERFQLAAGQIVGKRLTYSHLTGKDQVGETEPF